jgi:hypothetical protein
LGHLGENGNEEIMTIKEKIEVNRNKMTEALRVGDFKRYGEYEKRIIELTNKLSDTIKGYKAGKPQ